MLIAAASLGIMALAVYLLAIITDEYFIVSLDQIAKRLKLPHNVAGASLMAMGSSAPELAIALLALFTAGGQHSDLGIGTIVGSAVFNILIITGVSAIARPARISWPVAVRDLIVYVLCVALLIFAISDGTVTWLEALAFLVLYAVYLVLLFRWDSLALPDEDIIEVVEEEIKEEHARAGLYFRVTDQVSRVIGLFTGDCRGNCLRTFFVSIGFIGLLSWVLVEAAVRFSDALQIPPVIVALTLLAAGTSVPDMFASVIVARQGRGGMAVANAVGSNIFDILVGLGVPWLIALVVLGNTVTIGTDGLMTSALILAATVVILGIFLATDRLLTRKEGWALVAAYVVYVVWIVIGS